MSHICLCFCLHAITYTKGKQERDRETTLQRMFVDPPSPQAFLSYLVTEVGGASLGTFGRLLTGPQPLLDDCLLTLQYRGSIVSRDCP